MLKGMHVLITGGAGMLGSTIAQRAVKEGAKVTVIDALLPLYGGNLFNLKEIWDQIEFIEGDIRNHELVNLLVRGKDIIFNLAAQVSYVDSNLDPFLDLDINCLGILNVLDACRLYAPNARILFSSSRFVYGRIDYNPVDESHPFNSLSIYGIHKLAGEKYHRFYHDAHGLSTTCLRIANPYGPHQQMKHGKYGIANWFIRQAFDNKCLTVFGDGLQRRDYIYSEDVADAFLAVALCANGAGEVFNLGSGTGTPFIDMVRTISAHFPLSTVQQVEWPKDRYFVESGDYITDIQKIWKFAGWRPRTCLEEGIARTVDFYKQHHAMYW